MYEIPYLLEKLLDERRVHYFLSDTDMKGTILASVKNCSQNTLRFPTLEKLKENLKLLADSICLDRPKSIEFRQLELPSKVTADLLTTQKLSLRIIRDYGFRLDVLYLKRMR